MDEPRLIAIRNGLLLALAFAAGYIDALSYLGLSRVFTANMTGNTVLLGIVLADFDGVAIARSSLALAGFARAHARVAHPARICRWLVPDTRYVGERDHNRSSDRDVSARNGCAERGS
jgi:uncharacterized membrane protein YoaK (UPF0700 family)